MRHPRVRVRAYADDDRDDLLTFFQRAEDGSPSNVLWQHPASEAAVYLLPYVDLEPQSLLVAFDGAEIVGYLTGCLDTHAFPSEEERLETAIREFGLLWKPKPLAFFLRAAIDTLICRLSKIQTATDFCDHRWPAHLHINVAQQHRKAGVGRALLESWFTLLRQKTIRGCHLSVLAENVAAVAFFRRMGFDLHGTLARVPGSRYRGQKVHQQILVRSV